MNEFIAFVRSLGIVIDHLPPIGRWVRLPTVSHPRKKNGAVKFMGDHGFAQEHSTMTDVAVWQAERGSDYQIDHAALQAAARREQERIAKRRARAVVMAARILDESELSCHSYLARKGFADHKARVIVRDGQRLVVVPMRVDGALVGCQLINDDGEKKFLPGQQSKGATFTLGTGFPAVWCEGYATALSAQAALQAARMPRSVVCCFSANNLTYLAKTGAVIADNDASGTGLKAAIATGLPYWISDTVGEDFNDYHLRVGMFKASQSLKAQLMRKRAGVTASPS